MHRRDLLLSTLTGTAVLAFAPARGAAGKRDWAAMARRDLKPIQANLANVYATGSSTMASSDHPYATEAALWALERGGSAADAYMTAGIAQCVLEPTMTTLGGGFGMAFWEAESRQLAQGGGFFAFPSGAPPGEPYDERKSWTAWGAMVPGFVRGLQVCHAAWGKLPWRDLFEPAIVFAEEGFVIDHMLWGYAKATRKMIGRFPGPGRDAWFRDGYMLGVGDTLRQPALAATLKALRDEGPDYFYTGPFARELATQVQRRGGGITEDDLKNYDQARISPPWKPGRGRRHALPGIRGGARFRRPLPARAARLRSRGSEEHGPPDGIRRGAAHPSTTRPGTLDTRPRPHPGKSGGIRLRTTTLPRCWMRSVPGRRARSWAFPRRPAH